MRILRKKSANNKNLIVLDIGTQCGGGSKLPGIKQALQKGSDFQVRPIFSQVIIKIKNRTNLKNIPCLALAELALKSSEETIFSSTLNRVMRLIQE